MFKGIPRVIILSFILYPLLASADGSSFKLSDLAWMEGSWKGTSPAGIYENSFSSPSGALMIGMAKLTSSDGALSFYEYDEIKTAAAGIQLTPIPFGQRGVSFTAVEESPKRVVFENAGHDFPRRITYSINDKGQFVSVVEGTQSGQPIRLEFVLDKN